MPTPTVLDAEVVKVAARIRKATKRRPNDQNSDASMIEPILRALGWDPEDVDKVVREYCSRSKDSPVGCGFFVNRTSKLFVEAEPHGENLGDHRWANQAMGFMPSRNGTSWSTPVPTVNRNEIS